MSKIIWMSDLHFVATGEVQGLDPRTRLHAAIEHINAHHADAAVCIVSGDMVDRGTAADYEAVASMLSHLSMPYHPMVGNHDNRALFRKQLPLPSSCDDVFIQYAVDADDAVLLCLDTLDEGADAGVFCEDREAWLIEKLAQSSDKPVVLFMHHPPLPLHLPMQDQDRLRDGPRFLSLIAGRPNVRHLCIGHVHRPITGVVEGIPFTTMRSVLYQAPAPVPRWDWDSFRPAAEAPNLGVILLDKQDITIQFEQFSAAQDVGRAVAD